ncbi:MAG TPA: hypothetical protein PKL78_11030 [Anaerolineales bacterium]|nr:hypothetical protein [Anaerolineales bacterium]HNN14084.1 hypothetical protein [Anaerolineales bacterium]HNO31132.1 hypothetical protein [Anaerolineales bacterium]
MKIIKNEKLITRNGKIGNWVSLGALLVLGAGMYISFAKPEWITYSLICLAVGFIMTQVGMYMGSRWGRSPRPDEKLDAGLKGLHSEFSIYHYSTPVSHLLVGPSGLWVLMPYHQGGKVSFQKGRWKLTGGGFLQGYMRIFGQEGLGRPELESVGEANTLTKFLAKKMEGSAIPEVKPILVFTHDEVEVDAGDSPVPAMRLKQLKDFLRQGSKNRALTSNQIAEINKVLE